MDNIVMPDALQLLNNLDKAMVYFLGALRYLLTSAVNNGEKHLVDFIRQPDGKSLGILGQVT